MQVMEGFVGQLASTSAPTTPMGSPSGAETAAAVGAVAAAAPRKAKEMAWASGRYAARCAKRAE